MPPFFFARFLGSQIFRLQACFLGCQIFRLQACFLIFSGWVPPTSSSLLQKYNSQEKNLFFSEVLHECNTPVFYNIKPKLNLSKIFFRLEQRTCKKFVEFYIECVSIHILEIIAQSSPLRLCNF